MTVHGLCRSCGTIVTYIEDGLDPEYHVTCGPNLKAGPVLFSEPTGPLPRDATLQQDLTEVIMWAWRGSDRSLQKMIGPSELGEVCERKLAYRIAGLPGLNENMDPWPALVGTAIHQWLEEAITTFQNVAGAERWLTEIEVYPDDVVIGHCDLFDTATGGVWDFKTMASDKLKAFSNFCREDPSTWPDQYRGYRTQVHTYGLGMARAGYDVKTVGLIGLPRSGWLSNMTCWSEPYDPSIAHEALSRMYEVANRVMELGVDQRPEQITAVPATPSRLCGYCDFYNPNIPPGTAGSAGCPGA